MPPGPPTGGLSFAWESVVTALSDREAADLVAAHWHEATPFAGALPLDPDIARVADLADRGVYHLWTARDRGGFLVGYIGWLLERPLQHRRSLIAYTDHYTIARAYRPAGREMFAQAFDALHKMGVRGVVCSAPVYRRGFGRFFRSLGFAPEAEQWWRGL